MKGGRFHAKVTKSRSKSPKAGVFQRGTETTGEAYQETRSYVSLCEYGWRCACTCSRDTTDHEGLELFTPNFESRKIKI